MPSHYEPKVLTLDLTADAGIDIVGDLHGCMDELYDLLRKAGYAVSGRIDRKGIHISHPEDRHLFLVGDITDRGPRSLDALRFVRDLIASGMGNCVMGNHDDKLLRALMGRKVKPANGLQGTLDELNGIPLEERDGFIEMLKSMPTQVLLRRPGQREVLIVHGAAPEHHQLLPVKNSYERSIYGYPKEAADGGPPIREDWAATYSGERIVVHGHVPGTRPAIKNRVFNLDTGCAFGNRLTMVQIDKKRFMSVPAREVYYERKNFDRRSFIPAWIDNLIGGMRLRAA